MKSDFLQAFETQWQEHFRPSDKKDWLDLLRQQQLGEFLKQGFPTSQNERWKYTHLGPVKLHDYSPFVGMRDHKVKDITPFRLKDSSHQLVFINGYYDEKLSTVGQFVSNLTQGLVSHNEIIKTQLNTHQATHSFSCLNTAGMQDGAFIYLSANNKIAGYIHLLFINTEQSCDSMQHIRNIIVAEPNSSLAIVEQHVSLAENNYATNVVTQIDLGRGAQINYVKIQDQNHSSLHFANLDIKQQQDSTLNMHHLNVGSQLTRDDINAHLNGRGAAFSLQGLYLPLNKQHMDIQTHIHHNADATTSEEFYKGVVGNKSRAVFNGKISVAEKTRHVIANLQNKNLLLESNSEVNTKPELEIYSDEVKCRHGATVGQLDHEMIFYMRSRGVPLVAAYKMLLEGFVKENLDTIPHAELAEKVSALLANYCEVVPNE